MAPTRFIKLFHFGSTSTIDIEPVSQFPGLGGKRIKIGVGPLFGHFPAVFLCQSQQFLSRLGFLYLCDQFRCNNHIITTVQYRSHFTD